MKNSSFLFLALMTILNLAPQKGEAQSSARWSHTGRCNEVTPDGLYIQNLNSNICRDSQGSYAAWSDGRCNEYTPDGLYIQNLNSNICR